MVNIPVILCFDERILLGAGVTILSMIDSANDGTSYDIRILHPGLSQSAIDGLDGLVTNTNHRIQFTKVPASRFANVPTNRGSWTEIVYYRLLASELINDCDRAIYSDVDVFVKRDLSDAYNIDLKEHDWAGVVAEANLPSNVMHRHFEENKKQHIYFSGFMVMNLKLMRQNNAVARYFTTIEMHSDRLKFFDLDVLNIATPKIARLPFDYVVLEDVYESLSVRDSKDFAYLKSAYSEDELEAARQNPAIVHFAGRRGKPWQRRQVPDYYRNVALRLPKELKKKTFRDWRKTWLSKKGRKKYPLRNAQ